MAKATLYRCPTRTNWLCPCGRVARDLRRRGYEVEEVRVALRKRRRPEVEELTGQRAVPVLQVGREVIVDSRRIVQNLEFRSGLRS